MSNPKSSKPPLPDNPSDRYLFLRDPWNFLTYAAYTKDQVDITQPIKPAPSHREYIKTLTDLWIENPLITIVKSRRMWISWLFICLYLHDTITHRHRETYFVSKKESDADELVRRALLVYKNIPRNIWHPDFLPKARYKENHLIFDEIGSSINAVASGEDQLRQYTASGILMDEFGFWEKASGTYTAAKPTIDGGGRVTIVSTPPRQISAEPSFFRNLCYDNLEFA